MKKLLWLILLLGAPVAAGEDTDKLANIKVYQSERLRIIFERGFQEHIIPLADAVEAYLAEMESRWSVILPEEKIRITLGLGDAATIGHAHLPGGPSWLSAGYDREYRRIEIGIERLGDYRQEPVLRELRHQLVHYLLNLKRQYHLPLFLEEGLADYYAGTKGADRFGVILAFARNESLIPWLAEESEITSRSQRRTYAAVGRLFVTWLWDQKPGSELKFLQTYLRGNTQSYAFKAADLPPMTELVTAFEAEVRPKNKLYHLFLTRDFWIILVGLIILIYMLRRVIRAWQVSRMEFKTIGPMVELPDPALFTGPAFEPTMPEEEPDPALREAPEPPVETPTVPPRPHAEPTWAVEPAMPGSNPFAELEDSDMDHIFANLDTPLPNTPAAGQTGPEDAPNPFADIDDELEDVFSQMAPVESAVRNPMDHAPEKEADENEDEVDRIFGGWDVG
ncbi:MAG: hypothetical protein QNK37_18540 [Acidobacteriota bacterium]|nr:hypothetical protein [Acidobacteriota bacterium]